MKKIFEKLKSEGILKKNKIIPSAVNSLTPEKTIQLLRLIINQTKDVIDPKREVVFDHTASLAMGGGRSECSYLGCRIRRIDELTRFATFYSDRVLINNSFADYFHLKIENEDDFLRIKHLFYEDLLLLIKLNHF